MKRRSIRAFTMLHPLLWIMLAGVIVTMSVYAMNQSLRIQQRVTTWANDDAVTHDIIRRMRADLDTATGADVVEEDGPVLVVRAAEGSVRYRTSGNRVERSEQKVDGTSPRFAWRLQRSSIEWKVERAATGRPLVWLVVRIHDPVTHRRSQVDRYATALRVGARAEKEAGP